MTTQHETDGATGYTYLHTVETATIKLPTVVVGDFVNYTNLVTGVLVGKTDDGFAVVLVEGAREEWPTSNVRR